jgi:hypothetical protein
VITKIVIKKNADGPAVDSARWQKLVWACEFVFLILLVIIDRSWTMCLNLFFSLDTMWTILCEFISLLKWESASGKLLPLNQNILHVVILTSKTGGWAGKTWPRFEVLTAVSMKADFVWDVTPCILVHTSAFFQNFAT